MPVLDGWGFISAYNQLIDSRTIPIVSVSGEIDPTRAERLRQLGVHICLVKPFELEELLDYVAQLCGHPAVERTDAGGRRRLDGV